MKRLIKRLLLSLLLISLTVCATKENLKVNFPQEIESISFEKWTGGRSEAGSGTTITIEFKKPLQNNIHLQKQNIAQVFIPMLYIGNNIHQMRRLKISI